MYKDLVIIDNEKISLENNNFYCDNFEANRLSLQTQYPIPDGWWLVQPNITAKYGWICHSVADDIHVAALML